MDSQNASCGINRGRICFQFDYRQAVLVEKPIWRKFFQDNALRAIRKMNVLNVLCVNCTSCCRLRVYKQQPCIGERHARSSSEIRRTEEKIQ